MQYNHPNVSHESKLKLYKPNLTSYSFNVIKHVVYQPHVCSVDQSEHIKID